MVAHGKQVKAAVKAATGGGAAPQTAAEIKLPAQPWGTAAPPAKAEQARLSQQIEANEAKINAELIAAQGKPVDTGGYYLPDQAKTSAGMRPSATLNAALDAL